MAKIIKGGIWMLPRLVSITFIFVMAITGILQAAWWDGKSIPVPQDTQESYQQAKKILGSVFVFTYYTSSQSADAIKDFYRVKLPELGWAEKDFKSGASNENVFAQNLFFEKNSERMIIAFLPQALSSGDKLEFSVARGKLEVNGKDSSQQNIAPTLLAKPQKDVAPTYPGAALLTLSEEADFLRATYSTTDHPDAVAAFYKDNMAKYNWSLENEMPFEKRKPDNSALEEAKNSSAFAGHNEKLGAILDSIETGSAELNFTNAKGDVCKIAISCIVLPKDMDKDLRNITTILVNYEKRRK